MSVELHPLNRDFQWRMPAPPYRFVTAEQAAQYDRDGFFALHGVFSVEEIAAVRSAIDPLEAQADAYLRTREHGTLGIARADDIVFNPHLVNRCELLRDFSCHPVFAGVAADLIGGRVRLYWDQLVYKKPDTADEFPWHQDNGYTFIDPQQYLTCWVALTDATVKNGCPWVVPGLHQRGTLLHRWTRLGFECLSIDDAASAVPIELDAGSVAVFSSLTPHRTGPNLTDGVRKAYILQYAPDGARVFRADGESELCAAPDRQYLIEGDA